MDIIDDPEHGHGNSGPGWPMPTAKPIPDSELAHPSWCSPDHCTASDSLIARGISELEVDGYVRSQHWSAPRVIGADREDPQSEATFTFALSRWIYQPIEDGRPDQLIMTVRFVEYLMVFAVPLSGRQVRVMAEALLEYADAWPVNGDAR